MKAIVQDRYGSADVLELTDIDKPVVGSGDVLLRVHAASAHIGDWHVMTGLPYLLRILGFGFRRPKARVRGMDAAGRVEEIGTDVTRFQPGDEVFGIAAGSFAEYATARDDKIAPKPTNLSFEQAATVPTSCFAALQALRDKGGAARAEGADHRCRGSRRVIRRADREDVRGPRHRCVQHVEGRPRPIASARTTSSTTRATTSR